MIKKMLKNLPAMDRILFGLVLIILPLGFLIRIGTKAIQEVNASTLVFTQWWQDELNDDALKRIVSEFEATHPGITIKVEHLSYQKMEDRLLKKGPEETLRSDILAVDLRWLHELIRQDMLKPLNPYLEKTKTLENRVLLPGLQTEDIQESERVWALPVVSFMIPLFYNVEVLQSAGFNRPPKSRADFLHYARTITDSSTGRFGMALALNQGYPDSLYVDVYSWIWAAGGIMLHDGRPNFTSPPVLETLDFLNTLYQEGLLSPDLFVKTRAQKLEEFTQGKIGMMIASVQDIYTLQQEMGDTRFGITTIPDLDMSKKPVFGLTSWYTGISQYSEHQDQAWAFITFLAERSAFLALASHAVPGNWSGTRSLKGDLYVKAYDMYEGGEVMQEFIGLPQIQFLETIVREELYTMFTQGKTPAATAAAIQTRWERTLP
ncbi:MAG: sugar ABC transporter substrate-binding protein [Treponema sp.]|jgi:multiple sugar transport system substrate-binding protein|nr:sugar ABC transporter substrate-binding protein [Treponema sp.]